MSKNIVIFSDGTGQGGGLILDERRSNVYKLFRATRSGPESSIAPDQQIAFYDPGLGSSRDNEHIKFSFPRKIYNVLSQATGLGITRNIIDCYAFLIQHWQEGDRVYVFGFSRGAYTARCVGGVMAYCGIPTKEHGKPIKRDPKTARRLAEIAVKKVYQHGVGSPIPRFAEQRRQLAEQFRENYASAFLIDGKPQGWSNVVPYFIGVWDAVAALGASLPRLLGLGAILLAIIWSIFAGLYPLAQWLGWIGPEVSYLTWILSLTGATIGLGFILYFLTHIRFVTGLSDPWWKTIHMRAWKMKIYDTYLNPRVMYAKHALSIDENRRDFERVPWTDRSKNQHMKEKDWFEQIWFAGVHSDIGGSYPETESRLSDITLQWMVEKATHAKHPLLLDKHYLRTYPDPSGVQHDERKNSFLPWKLGLRPVPQDAPLHTTVIERFEAASVVHYDEVKPYRPESLRQHRDVAHFYSNKNK